MDRQCERQPKHQAGGGIRRVAIVGMGALGLLYGSLIKKHAPETELCYVMDKKRAEKYRDAPFTVNGEPMQFSVADADSAVLADLLMVAVKYTGLKDALDVMKRCIGPDTIIISVMNGISSERIIGERYSMEHLVYVVAQGMDAMKFGNSLTYTQAGELRVGITEGGKREDLERLTAFFDRAGISYTVEEDIIRRMWGKFLLNVGINQVCMVYGQTYGQALSKGESNRALFAAFREVLAVAAAEGVNLSETDISQYVALLKTLDPDSTPSMGQDRINRKPSEVDMFAGTVMELGKKHGIEVPANEYLYERAKEIEAGYCQA